MNINDQFTASKYLKAADLKGSVAKVKIRDVTVEEVGSDRRMVAWFQGKEKGMVLNKTNAMTIGETLGPDTDAWTGAEIEVFSMKVEYQGKMVDGLRIRVPRRSPAQRPAPVANNWQAPPNQPPPGQPPQEVPYDNGFDDSESIPF